MFDKMVISGKHSGEKTRSGYFAVTTFLVAALFSTSLVFSIFAADISLLTAELDSSRLLTPVIDNVPETFDEPKEQAPANAAHSARSELPTRVKLIARTDQPQNVPTETSSTPSQYKPMPDGRFRQGPLDSDASSASGSDTRRTGSGSGEGLVKTGTGSTPPQLEDRTEIVKTPPPPPVEQPKPPVIRSLGVVNGKAIDLPKPSFPHNSVNITGNNEVRVQITINEQGNVISANAVSGHPLLRANAVNAARRAKFHPTLLSNQPVKVTGYIVYNFTR